MADLTLIELRDWLADQGWTIGVTPRIKHTGSPWYAYRRMEYAPVCANNQKAPLLALWPYALNHEHHTWESVEIEITAASGLQDGEQWWKLMAYSIQPGKVIDRLPAITRALGAAWRAVVESEE